MSDWYKEDLAFIHDVGFADFACNSAPGILEVLERYGISEGLVIDLGCGSGLLAHELLKHGYHLLGIDISEAMIRIARTRAPGAEFRVESVFKSALPPCGAVTAISECLSYAFDPDHDERGLDRLFSRVYDALTPGGVFIFDLVEPGQVEPGAVYRGFTEGEDWVVLVEKHEDLARRLLTRRIITFRKEGDRYRRDAEVHQQHLCNPEHVAEMLGVLGFQVHVERSYGGYALPIARVAFVARKPA